MNDVAYRAVLVAPNGRARDLDGDLIGAIDATLVEADIGVLKFESALGSLYDDLEKDAQVFLYRRPYGASAQLVGRGPWFVRGRTRSTSRSGALVTATAQHCTCLLDTRIVAYASESAQSSKLGPAGNLLRQFARENLGALAGTGRNWSDRILIGADVGEGAVVDKAASRQNLLTTMQSVAKMSREKGSYITFSVEGGLGTPFALRVSTTALGTDRRLGTSTLPALFGLDYGNVSEVRVSEDWIGERSVIYVGGSGEEESRIVRTISDDELTVASPFGRREDWVDARITGRSNVTRLDDLGYAQLYATRGKVLFEADYLEGAGSRFGVDVDWGDFVTGVDQGLRVDVRLPTVTLQASQREELVQMTLRGERS